MLERKKKNPQWNHNLRIKYLLDGNTDPISGLVVLREAFVPGWSWSWLSPGPTIPENKHLQILIPVTPARLILKCSGWLNTIAALFFLYSFFCVSHFLLHISYMLPLSLVTPSWRSSVQTHGFVTLLPHCTSLPSFLDGARTSARMEHNPCRWFLCFSLRRLGVCLWGGGGSAQLGVWP